MKIFFIDVYKKSNTRICKDTAGGYGTENNMGPGLISMLAEKFLKYSLFWPSLSFAQLATEIKIKLKDIYYYTMKTPDDIPSELCEVSQEKVLIFICGSIVCFETEVSLIKLLKQRNPNGEFVYCGSVGEHLINHIPEYCHVLSGNYEFLIQNVENHFALRDVDAATILQYIKMAQLTRVINGDPQILSNIDWSILGLINTKNKLLARGDAFPIITSRGCPYSCFSYCTYPTSQGRKVLHEPVQSVIMKLSALSKSAIETHIIFRDPVFSINLNYSKELLQAIIDERLNLNFTAELHLKNLDFEFIELAKKANFKWFKFGIESAIDSVRKASGRYSISNDIQKEKIAILNEIGIKTDGMFILCQPTDTIETCYQTIDYSLSLGLDMAQFSVFTPYPGTPYYGKVVDKINTPIFENFTQFNLIYNHPTISSKKAALLVRDAHVKFYRAKIFKKLTNFSLFY